MTETPQNPGVRYKKITVERPETTVIDGKPSTYMVRCKERVALPPRDWDEIIRRGATTVAIVVTLLAAAGTTASVGGLLSRELLHPGVAYAVGAVFTSSWLVCLGIEHIERVDPTRAQRARVAGWVMLLIGMGAVITYGHEMEQLPAGVVGSCLDLAAKGLWWLILGLDRVQLAPGVAHWVAEQEQELAGRFLLGTRLARLNRRSAQMGGGSEFRAAEAILSQASGQGPAAAVPSGVTPVALSTTTPEPSASASAPVPVASVPDPDPAAPSVPVPAAPMPSGLTDDARTRVLTGLGLPLDNPGGAPAPSAPGPVPAPIASTQVPTASAQVPVAASVQPSAPASAAPAPQSSAVPAAPSAPSVPAVPGSAPASAQVPAASVQPSAPAPQPSAQSAPSPAVTPIGTPTIAAVVRTLTAADPGLAHVDRRDELIDLAAQQLPQQHAADPKKFAATVKRNLRVKAS